MNPIELLFVPGGRIGRLPYLVAGMASAMVIGLAAFVLLFSLMGAAAVSAPGDGDGVVAAGVVGLGFVGLLWLGYTYVVVILGTKRLHDLGSSGWNMAWVIGQGFAGEIAGRTHTIIGMGVYAVTLLVSLAFGIWLLVTPGDLIDNEYGPIPA